MECALRALSGHIEHMESNQRRLPGAGGPELGLGDMRGDPGRKGSEDCPDSKTKQRCRGK